MPRRNVAPATAFRVSLVSNLRGTMLERKAADRAAAFAAADQLLDEAEKRHTLAREFMTVRIAADPGDE